MSGANAATDTRPRSLWAYASLVTSVLACPPLCVLGVVLGIAGLVDVHRRDRRGRGVALAGILLGAFFTGGWITAGVWWNANVRRPLLEGPAAPLRAGLGGDLATFREAFVAPSGDAETRAFLAALGTNGALLAVEPDRSQPRTLRPEDIDRRRPTIPYVLHFERREIAAEAVFAVMPARGIRPVLRWSRLVVHEPDLGDLAYPVPASTDDEEASPSSMAPGE